MLNPIVCPRCMLPNEPARSMCWKCMRSLKEAATHDELSRLFELTPSWNRDELKLAFRKLARKYHPDANLNNPDADALFKFVNQAYEYMLHLGGPPERKEPPKKSEPPKPQAAPPAPAPTAGSLHVDSENFDILNDFIKDVRSKKPADNAPVTPKTIGKWFGKFFGNPKK